MTVRDSAEMLLVLFGAEAVSAAATFAADSELAGRLDEARYWRLVAEALVILNNPQPLLVPEARGERRAKR